MAKTAKKTAKTANVTAAAIPDDAKIIVVAGAENPFREGTAVYKRVQAVLLSKGKTVEFALKKGARKSTVKYLRDHKIVKVAA